jgi:hypothetical protein
MPIMNNFIPVFNNDSPREMPTFALQNIKV